MWQSLRISHLVLRISLALAFVWFGIDKFFRPLVWVNGTVPQSLIHLGAVFHVSAAMMIYVVGILELLVGISLSSGMFIETFATLGAVILISTPLFYGFNEGTIQALGLVGGLLALTFWPSRRFRNL